MDDIVKWNEQSGRNMDFVFHPRPCHIRNKTCTNAQTAVWKDSCAQRGIVPVDLFSDYERACERMAEKYLTDRFFMKSDNHWDARFHEFIFKSIDDRFAAFGFF